MKKNILFALATLCILASCKKNETPQPTPFVYEVTHAKINLGSTLSKGPVGCIELNDDGTYFAEVITPDGSYDGLDKYLQLPFERILVGTKDRKAATYVSGTYSAEAASYHFDGLGSLSFDPDMMFANYSFTDGKSYRDRTGITPGDKLPAFNAAKGQWTPHKADIQVKNLLDGTQFNGSYDSMDWGKMATDAAACCVPELERYLPLFEGYKMIQMTVSQLNTFVFDYANGKKLGGYWKFEKAEGTVNKTLEDKRVLSTTLTFTPALDGKHILLGISGEVKVDNQPAYRIEAHIELAC